VENALEEENVFVVPDHPMLIASGLDLPEVKSSIWMKGEIYPVLVLD